MRKKNSSSKGDLQSLMGLDLFVLLFVSSLAINLATLPSIFAPTNAPNDGEMVAAPAANAKDKTADPFFILEEAQGWSFDSGKAILSEKLEKELREPIANKIVRLAREHDAYRVEIVGHTDGVGVKDELKCKSNLDFKLTNPEVWTGTVTQKTDLIPADNIGLGMMRAIAVVQFLVTDPISAPKMKHLTLVPMSAGSAVLRDGTLAKGGVSPEEKRRRIEIRLLRLSYK